MMHGNARWLVSTKNHYLVALRSGISDQKRGRNEWKQKRMMKMAEAANYRNRRAGEKKKRKTKTEHQRR